MARFGVRRSIFVPYNGKIADISEDDTDKHYLDLETALSETRKITLVILGVDRQAGFGYLLAYPNEGDTFGMYESDPPLLHPIGIADGTQRLQYQQTVADNDFDLYCFGYWVEA